MKQGLPARRSPLGGPPGGRGGYSYVLLRGMLPERAKAPQPVESTRSLEEWGPSPDAPVVRRLSVAGMARGEHDLGARSEEILRRELGHSAE